MSNVTNRNQCLDTCNVLDLSHFNAFKNKNLKDSKFRPNA